MTAEIEIVGSNFTGTKTILNEDVLGGETEESALLIYESEKGEDGRRIWNSVPSLIQTLVSSRIAHRSCLPEAY